MTVGHLRILIIEDDLAIASNIYDYLEAHGHHLEVAYDGVRGFKLASQEAFDIIILDLGLPRMDGVDLCRKLRNEASIDTPILVLTARDTLDDKLAGFQSGADDYLVKPFALAEINARINALHNRRKGKIASRMIELGNLIFDSRKMTVTYANTIVPLPPKCIRLLEILMSQPEKLFSRQELEIELWGEEQDNSDKLRHHLSLLRRALFQVSHQNLVKTVHGIGYGLSLEE